MNHPAGLRHDTRFSPFIRWDEPYALYWQERADAMRNLGCDVWFDLCQDRTLWKQDEVDWIIHWCLKAGVPGLERSAPEMRVQGLGFNCTGF